MVAKFLSVACIAALLVGTAACVPAADPPPVPPQSNLRQPTASLLLLPFSALNDDGRHQWISKAIQQNFMAELGQSASVRLIAPASQPAAAAPVDLQGAIQTAHDAQATLVVFGNYQVIEPDVRVMGQVVNADSGQLLGNLKATGKMSELFAIEDSLANQLQQLVAPAESINAQAPVYANPGATTYAPPTQSGYAPDQVSLYPSYADTYAYPYYSYPYYSYPYYYPYYPFWWPGAFVSFGLFFSDDHHHHDDHHDDHHGESHAHSGDFHHGDAHHGNFVSMDSSHHLHFSGDSSSAGRAHSADVHSSSSGQHWVTSGGGTSIHHSSVSAAASAGRTVSGPTFAARPSVSSVSRSTPSRSGSAGTGFHSGATASRSAPAPSHSGGSSWGGSSHAGGGSGGGFHASGGGGGSHGGGGGGGSHGGGGGHGR